MWKKNLSIIFVVLIFLLIVVFLVPHDKVYRVVEIKSPLEIKLSGNKDFYIKDLEYFDSKFSEKNKELAKSLNISEEEAFVIGNLSKYWASSLIKNRNVVIKNDNDLVYLKYSYRKKFMYSGFCIINSKPYDYKTFEKRLKEIRSAKYKILDLDTEKVYELDDKSAHSLKNYMIIRKSSLHKKFNEKFIQKTYSEGDLKIFLTDMTSKRKPDRYCSTSMCQEILNKINNAEKTIDMAIYGYSRTYAIEEAIKNAINRGVKVRLIYDIDSKGKNIYPDTQRILSIVSNNKNDGSSLEVQSIMHNKFYIFDDKILITGSANLSHTDMSGYNSNSVVVINSSEVAKIYKTEFEQMFSGKFHNDKTSQATNKINISGKDLEIYFSPQDKSLTNVVLPLIRKAKKYIYIPTFVLTEGRVTEELIRAKQRGVDVRIIIDALNASVKHSKHNELRNGGLLVKTENFGGKMHAKSMIVDDEYTIVGSMNFSNSGEKRNDENLILIKDSEITTFYKEFFLYQWDKIGDKWLKINARAEGKDSLGSCEDGIDNNYDGLTDMEDVACQ